MVRRERVMTGADCWCCLPRVAILKGINLVNRGGVVNGQFDGQPSGGRASRGRMPKKGQKAGEDDDHLAH